MLVLQGTDKKGNLVTSLEFSPDGLNFGPPLELHYYATGAEGKPIDFYWIDELNGKPVLLETDQIGSSKAVFEVYHFSKYRIWEGSVSASGL